VAELSLRERKKKETAARLWQTAIAMFAERGFDKVSTAEIAAAADVSKMTLFNYFATKEDLVLSPVWEHVDEPARTVRERAEGQSPVAALRVQFLAAMAARDPAAGLSDSPSFLDIQRLIRSTPSLLVRVLRFEVLRIDALAEALAEPGGPQPLDRVRAAQIIGVISALAEHNVGRLLDGEKVEEVYPDAVELAEQGFALLEPGSA
jgi:AcrR family transcriptional regulator